MTMQEFIDQFGVDAKYKTQWGFKIGDSAARYALPCACGLSDCKGWAMVSAIQATNHLELYGPMR